MVRVDVEIQIGKEQYIRRSSNEEGLEDSLRKEQ